MARERVLEVSLALVALLLWPEIGQARPAADPCPSFCKRLASCRLLPELAGDEQADAAAPEDEQSSAAQPEEESSEPSDPAETCLAFCARLRQDEPAALTTLISCTDTASCDGVQGCLDNFVAPRCTQLCTKAVDECGVGTTVRQCNCEPSPGGEQHCPCQDTPIPLDEAHDDCIAECMGGLIFDYDALTAYSRCVATTACDEIEDNCLPLFRDSDEGEDIPPAEDDPVLATAPAPGGATVPALGVATVPAPGVRTGDGAAQQAVARAVASEWTVPAPAAASPGVTSTAGPAVSGCSVASGESPSSSLPIFLLISCGLFLLGRSR